MNAAKILILITCVSLISSFQDPKKSSQLITKNKVKEQNDARMNSPEANAKRKVKKVLGSRRLSSSNKSKSKEEYKIGNIDGLIQDGLSKITCKNSLEARVALLFAYKIKLLHDMYDEKNYENDNMPEPTAIDLNFPELQAKCKGTDEPDAEEMLTLVNEIVSSKGNNSNTNVDYGLIKSFIKSEMVSYTTSTFKVINRLFGPLYSEIKVKSDGLNLDEVISQNNCSQNTNSIDGNSRVLRVILIGYNESEGIWYAKLVMKNSVKDIKIKLWNTCNLKENLFYFFHKYPVKKTDSSSQLNNSLNEECNFSNINENIEEIKVSGGHNVTEVKKHCGDFYYLRGEFSNANNEKLVISKLPINSNSNSESFFTGRLYTKQNGNKTLVERITVDMNLSKIGTAGIISEKIGTLLYDNKIFDLVNYVAVWDNEKMEIKLKEGKEGNEIDIARWSQN